MASTLSAKQTLQALGVIDKALNAFCETAPVAVNAIGGREAIQPLCRMTSLCMGPVPRLTAEQWAPMALEHAFRGSRYGAPNPQGGMQDRSNWQVGPLHPPAGCLGARSAGG